MNKNKNIEQGMKYLIVGGMTTGLNYLVYGVLIFMVPYLTANSIAWLIAVFFSWYANRTYVFGATESWRTELAQFFLARLGTFVFESVLLFLMIEVTRFHAVISKISLAGIVILLNYIFCKKKIFHHTKSYL